MFDNTIVHLYIYIYIPVFFLHQVILVIVFGFESMDPPTVMVDPIHLTNLRDRLEK